MELKKALGVCLISFFSAAIVVLIARWLDDRAAERLEPQLAAIVDELRALRNQGGPVVAKETDTSDAELVVYMFHGEPCPTCRLIESKARAVVENDYGDRLRNGSLVWKVINYNKPSGAELKTKFEVHVPVVVVAKMKDGEIEHWERLDRVMALSTSDPSALDEYIRKGIENVLNPPATPKIPLPGEPAFPEFGGDEP
ncbi:MAG: hypothetical protein JW959_06040 [Pirellulales bacterium]|nr:hypothetical protein [Pirellulales bacterium]